MRITTFLFQNRAQPLLRSVHKYIPTWIYRKSAVVQSNAMYMIRQSFPDSWQDRTCRIHLFFLFLLLRSINILMDDIGEGAVAFKLGLDTMGWNLFQRSIGIILHILVFTINSLCQEFKKTAATSNEAPSERLSPRCVLLQTIAHMILFESFLKNMKWSHLFSIKWNGMI